MINLNAQSFENINKMNVRQCASEMLTFIRCFGLPADDFIPIEEPVRDLYLTTRRVLPSKSLEIASNIGGKNERTLFKV